MSPKEPHSRPDPDDVGRLERLLVESEDRLTRLVLDYAAEHEFTKYTSTLQEAWRISIEGLTYSLVQAVRSRGWDLSIDVDEDVPDDPAVSFGIHEAVQHRSRGVTLAQFLGLMKYYRRSYLDLVAERIDDKTAADMYASAVDWFFDRVEIGFASQWADMSEDSIIDELRARARAMTNEKNRYLTIFESLKVPALLLDADGLIVNVNQAAALAFGLRPSPGSAYYSSLSLGGAFGPLLDEIERFCHADSTEASFERTLKTQVGERHFLVSLKQMLDVSGKFVGTTLLLDDITERKTAEDEDRRTSQLYQGLIKNMTTGFAQHRIVTDESGRAVDYVFLGVNPAFERLTGLASGDLIGRRVTEVLPGIEEGMFDWIEAYGRVALEMETVTFEQYSEQLDRWYEVAAYPLGGGRFATVFTDVSAHKNVASELRESLDAYLSILEDFPALIWRAGVDAKCDWFNRGWLEFTGRPIEEQLGDGWAESVHPDDLTDCVATYVEAFEAREPFSMEYRLRRHDGVYRWIVDHGRPFRDAGGGFSGYIGACWDIEERMNREGDLARLVAERTAELEHSLREARAADAAKSRFLAGMSHELRTPLNSVIGFSGVLLSELPGELNDEQRTQVDMIRRSGERLLTLIEDVLAISQMEQGTMRVSGEPFDAVDLAAEAVDGVLGELDGEGCRVDVRSEAGAVRCGSDRTMVRRILAELVRSAMGDSAAGPVDVDVRRSGSSVRFSVTSRGGSGEQADLGALSDDFALMGVPGTRAAGGSGLGMAVARHSAEALGGSLEVTRSDDGAPVFVLDLPCAMAASD